MPTKVKKIVIEEVSIKKLPEDVFKYDGSSYGVYITTMATCGDSYFYCVDDFPELGKFHDSHRDAIEAWVEAMDCGDRFEICVSAHEETRGWTTWRAVVRFKKPESY